MRTPRLKEAKYEKIMKSKANNPSSLVKLNSIRYCLNFIHVYQILSDTKY